MLVKHKVYRYSFLKSEAMELSGFFTFRFDET